MRAKSTRTKIKALQPQLIDELHNSGCILKLSQVKELLG